MLKRLLYIVALMTISHTVAIAQQGLNYWFYTPTTLQGRATWYGGKPDIKKEDKKPISAGDAINNSDEEWEQKSLPIGNGSIGANVMGSVAAERLTLNEKTLWRGGPNTSKGARYYWDVNKASAHIITDIRKAFIDNDHKRAEQLTRNNFNSVVPYETEAEEPFRFGSFTTAGELYIETGLSEVGMKNYRRSLSLDSALATVSFDKDGIHYRRDFFVSYPANVLVMRFSASKKGRQNLVLSYAKNPVSEGTMHTNGNDALLWNARLDNNSMQYCICMKAIPKGGTINNKNEKITVTGADEVVFIISADTDYKPNYDPDFDDATAYVGVDPINTTKSWIDLATKKGYKSLYEEHYADYSSLFNRVKLNINNASTNVLDIPITQRLANYKKGDAPDFYLEQLYYQFGRYLLIASSRPGNMPANLQGLWHNNVDGPWRIDYHTNINLQMNYWPACQTNLSECEKPLFSFIRTLIKPGKVTAKSYFGTRGWTTSVSANIFGFTSPLSSENMSWNFSPFAGPWLATHLWNYYDYTRDRFFLEHEAYDIIKNSANFAADYLWKRDDGIYTAAPSTSPEHGPIDEGATFAHAVVREILSDAIEASKLLRRDTKDRHVWEQALKHLAPYKIGRYGQLMEWSNDIDDPNDQHRHVNHLFGLHPGHTISPITTPELAHASRIVLEHRGDGATGWSMGWKLNQWARLHDGNHAYKLYSNLLKNGTLDNLWDTHAPFQIDGNFGGTAGVTEMLLQSHMGFIHLLPALPDAWAEGSVEGLRARGNFTVSITWNNGELSQATIHSGSGEQCVVRYNNKTLSFKTKKGQTYRVREINGKLTVNTPTYSSKLLFNKYAAQYRIPAIVQCKSGKIIAFADHRYHGTDIGWGHHLDIVIKTSCDGGNTWSPNEQMVARGGSNIATDFNCGHGDAATVVDRETGEILMMGASGGICYWDSTRDLPIMMGRYYSIDEGLTWHCEDVTKHIYQLMPDVTGAFFTSGRIAQSSRIKVGTHSQTTLP